MAGSSSFTYSTEWMEMARRVVRLELLPHERTAILKWKAAYGDVAARLRTDEACDEISIINITNVDLHWMASDLTHAIMKRGCHDEDVYGLSERLDFVDRTGDGALDAWY